MVRGSRILFLVWIFFFSKSHDIEYVVGMEIATDLGVTEYLFGLAMFFNTFNDMKYVVGVEIELYPGHIIFFSSCGICW